MPRFEQIPILSKASSGAPSPSESLAEQWLSPLGTAGCRGPGSGPMAVERGLSEAAFQDHSVVDGNFQLLECLSSFLAVGHTALVSYFLTSPTWQLASSKRASLGGSRDTMPVRQKSVCFFPKIYLF